MKETLEYIVKSIVDSPDTVQIDEQEENGILTLTITVAKEGMGKVIGKQGKIIRSIRNIMKIKAMKHNQRVNITVAETDKE